MNRISTLFFALIMCCSSFLTAQNESTFSLFDDFRDGDTSNVWGGAWKVFKGGAADNIQFEMIDADGYGRTKGCMHVHGKYSAFGGVEGWLDSSETEHDISELFDGISFAAKSVDGSQITARIRVRELKAESERGWAFFKYDFVPTEEWTLYNLPWDSLQVQYGDPDPPFDATDIKAIDIEAAAASEVVNIYIDDIIFWKGTPPSEIPTDDFTSMLDNFEDGDTSNAYGAPWKVFKGGVADNISFEMIQGEGYGRSNGSMKISGRYSAFGGVEAWLDSTEAPVALDRQFDGISFAAKANNGSTVTARVRVRELKGETDRGWGFFKYDFIPTEEWTLYNIPWDSLQVQYGDPIPPFNADDIKAIDFEAAAASEVVDITIDNLQFWRGTPPSEIPATDTLVLFDDFEDGDTSNVWGGPWKIFKGGVADNIGFEMMQGNGYAGSDGCVKISGKYSAFGGVESWLDISEEPQKIDNLFDGISFVAKAVDGSQVTARVRIREMKATSDRGWAFFKYDFVPTEKWTLYNIPWDSLQVQYGDPDPPFDASDIMAVDFEAALASEVVNILVDDIIFWRGTPPVEKPTDDFVSLFDDFEDGDTSNVWGAPWKVFKGGVADNITFDMVNGIGFEGSNGSMHVHGKFSAYGGAEGWLDSFEVPYDLSIEYDGIAFAAKAANNSDVMARVRIRELKAETDRGWAFFKYDFIPTENWTAYNLKWSDLEVQYGDPDPPFSATDIKAVDIAAALADEYVDIYIDQIVFWRGTPPLITDIKEIDLANIPNKFNLKQNYPNPFNPSTTIKFGIAKDGFYSLKVFNILGQEVANLINKNIKPGSYEILFDASSLPSGIYVYQLNGKNVSIAKKMMLLK